MLTGLLAWMAMAGTPQTEKEFKYVAVYGGEHSLVKKKRFELIEDAQAWKKLLAEHRDTEVDYKIDFDTQCVVCLFFGSHIFMPTVNRLMVESDSAVRIRYNDSFQFRPEPGVELPTLHPYIFVIMNRPQKPVVIQTDVRRDYSMPPRWREIERFMPQESK